MYVLYLAGEVEVVWTPDEKYIGLRNKEEKAAGKKGTGFTIEKKDSDYITQMIKQLIKDRPNEPGLTHKYSDADYKRIPEEDFAQIWIDLANVMNARLHDALREADRVDQAAEVANKVADLGFDADVQEDNSGQFIVYTGVSDPARRDEIESRALAVFENGGVEEDNGGQFVIYTGIGGQEDEEPVPAAAEGPNPEGDGVDAGGPGGSILPDVFEAEPDSPVASPPVVVPEPSKTEASYSLRSRSTAPQAATEN
jgi:hypothetical protein